MVYEYSWSGRQQPVKAEKVAAHFKKLESKYGEVTSRNFLDSARSEKSEMHKLFDWDDTSAAEKYRLYQASVVICSLKVTVKEFEDDEPTTIRAFVNVSDKDSGSFINIKKAMEDHDKSGKVLSDARMELTRFKNKFNNLIKAEKLMAAIDEFLEETA